MRPILWVGVSLWGPDVVRLMTAPSFHDATHLVWAVALIPVMQGIYFMCGTGFELGSNTRAMPLVSFLGLVTVVASAFMFIKPLGALGAALSTSLGWLVMAATIYPLSQRRFRIAYDWPTIGVFVVLAALFVLIGHGVQTAPIAGRLPILVLVSLLYPVFGFILLLLRSRDEKARMRILLSKLRLVSLNR
jgi:O-antigen/teichoic acid export membrane protein